MVAYNLRKVENRDRYPDPPSFLFTAGGRQEGEKKIVRAHAHTQKTPFSHTHATRILCLLACLLVQQVARPPPSKQASKQRIGAAEARWAHNPKVVRSKLTFATLFLLQFLLVGWLVRLVNSRTKSVERKCCSANWRSGSALGS